MNIQTKKKYRRIEDADEDELQKLAEKVKNCTWRQTYHIQPLTGLLNDPNGFSFFNGEYHLFYQWHPLEPKHGLKYWYHTKSKNLVHWENVGIAIKPDKPFDAQGAYSGSAIEQNGKLYLMYTGNNYDANGRRRPKQCMAIMDSEGKINKLDLPVIPNIPLEYTDHFRDPKVWKEGNQFYVLIGAQKVSNTGCAVLYSSHNLLSWSYKGEVKTNVEQKGYMWECPDYFVLQNQGILLFSPQGIEAEGDKYQNIYQSGYVVGERLDLDQARLQHGDFQELDRGFDFYVPQTTLDPKGRRLLVGWMGLPEVAYPSDKNGWAHCLTLPRELTLKDGKLIQNPVEELQLLRKKEYEVQGTLVNKKIQHDKLRGLAFEMVCEFSNWTAEEFGIEFRASEIEKTTIKYNSKQKKLILDRSLSGKEVATMYGTTRACECSSEKIKLHLFIDSSSVEIFVNDGEEVFTSRIFPDKNSDSVRFFADNGSVQYRSSKWDY